VYREQSLVAKLLRDLLTDDGLFLLQWTGLRRGLRPEDLIWGLFMNKYVFPGADASLCPSAMLKAMEKAGWETHSADWLAGVLERTLSALDAAMVETALERLAPEPDSVLMVENVGNLVCPAGFDLGEAHKVVVLSVTEGEDKPLKYPDMFHAASLMLLNKVDLLPHLSFDVQRCIADARRVNPAIEVMQVSATKGDGMDLWVNWVRLHSVTARHARTDQVVALKRRVAELEGKLAARA